MINDHKIKIPRMNNDEYKSPTLEPRVAKLEVGLDRLTEDVRSLAGIVREQGSQVESEIQKLVIAVTQASGPRKTDWSVIISAVLLVMAIGSAAFWPLNQTTQENKQTISVLEEKYDSHSAIANHPVGAALVSRLELELKLLRDKHEGDIKQAHEDAKEWNALTTKITELQLSALEKKVDLHNDRLFARVIKLEDRNLIADERERDELQLWRQRAMGLNNTVVPSAHSHLDAISPQK